MMRDNRKLLYIVCTLGLLTLCCNNNITLQLEQAASDGKVDVVKSLIDAGANVDLVLHKAVLEGNLEIVKTLIIAGADVNKEDLLREAAMNGHLEVVKALIIAGADDNEGAALVAAAMDGHLEIVKTLINAGADVNSESGFRALMFAAWKGHIEIVKALINAGADVNKEGLNGTALEAAAMYGHLEVVKEFINAGADIHNKNIALIAAARNGHIGVVKVLINAGAYGNMVLEEAVRQGKFEIVKVLINAGVDGNRVLDAAVKQGNFERDKALINAGVDVNAKSDDNWTVLHVATMHGTPPYEIAKLLVSAGADVNAENNLLLTPLDYVSEPYKSQIRQAKANPLHIPDKPQVQPSQAAILDAQANSSAPSPSLEDEDDEEEIIDESDEQEDSTSTAQKYGVKYIREITYKGKSTPSWIILQDTKGRPCAIVTSSKYPILESEHYCIPFSGDDKDLKDSFAGNCVAEIDFPDHKKCKNVKTISDNDYCNEFYKAFGDMAKREQFFSVAGICKNDPYVDSEFQDHICEYLNLEDDLD